MDILAWRDCIRSSAGKNIVFERIIVSYLPTSETFNEGDLPLSYDS
jgi:hypothetical protein